MKKKLVIALAIVVTGIAGVVVTALYRTNEIVAAYKPHLEAFLSEKLGARLQLGSFRVSIIPQPVITVSKLTIRDLHGQDTGISVGAIEAQATLWPLLSKRLEISSVSVIRPVIKLKKTASGVTVPGIEPGAHQPPSVAQSASLPSTTPANSTSPLALSIERILVRDGTVDIEDSEQRTSYSLQQVALNMGLALSGEDLRIPSGTLSFVAQGTIPVALTVADATFNKASGAARLPQCKVTLPPGMISISGKASSSKSSTLSLSTESLDLHEVMQLAAAFSPATTNIKPTGKMKLKANIETRYQADTAAEGTLLIADGSIGGLNIPGQALSKIDSLPFIAGTLRQRIPQEFEPLFSKQDTVIKELSSNFSISKGVLQLSDFILASDYFSLHGGGAYTFLGETNLKTELILNRAVSSGITSKVKELQPLVDTQGQLVIPLTISGKLPAVLVTPDINAILKKVSVAGVAQTLDKVLKDKNLGGKLGKILGF